MEEQLNLFFGFLENEKKVSLNTLQSYKRDLKQFENYLGTIEGKYNELTNDGIKDYIKYMQEQGKKTSTISRGLAAIRSFYQYETKNKQVEKDPTEGIQSPKIEKRVPSVLTSSEVALLLEQPKNVDLKGTRDKAMLEFAYATGMRVTEIISLNVEDINNLLELMKKNNFSKILAHAPYTTNLCSDKEDIREFAKNMMKEDLERMEYLPGNMYNFHPGSHVGQGVEQGIEYIAKALNEVLIKNQSTTVLLETMAGKGTEIGRSFEELKTIIDKVSLKEKLGVCLDTCHINDAGYDVSDIDKVLNEFDKIIGLKYLKAIHLNDSMNELGSHKDRHQKIGEGTIGITNFEKIINHPVLKDLPFYLETPNDLTGYAKEISLLRNLYKS